MPAERSNTTQKRRRLPFKPPRRQDSTTGQPSSATAAKTTKPSKKTASKKPTASASVSASKAARKSTSARQKARSPSVSSASGDEQQSGSEAGSASSSRSRSSSQEPDFILAEIITNNPRDIESGEPAIPPKLLTKLLHHHFQNDKTKIAKDANAVVAKYVDIFVREALARAAYERAEGESNADTGIGKRSVGDGFLEVEDLEKLAPQMVLDF